MSGATGDKRSAQCLCCIRQGDRLVTETGQRVDWVSSLAILGQARCPDSWWLLVCAELQGKVGSPQIPTTHQDS